MKMYYQHLFYLLFLCSGLSLSAQVPHASEINTGIRSRDNTAPVGSLDPKWVVAYGDSIKPNTAFEPAKVVGTCDVSWSSPPSFNANWITYDFGKDCEHLAFGCIDLYFRREIVLPATDECGVPIQQSYCLNMDFRADNNIYAVSVNGVMNYRHSAPGDPYKYNGTKNTVRVNICNGWAPGSNTLMVHTKSCPTLAGFLAEGVPEPVRPTTFLGKDTVLCSGSTFVLKSPWDNTLWFDETTAKAKTISKDGNYWASYRDLDGCIVTDTIAVRFGLKSFIPNAFSPNGDNSNDCFTPFFSHLDFVSYEFRIFDRLGNQVFTSNDPQVCWDGYSREKPCAEGIYVYALIFQTGECESTVLKGDLTLMR